ncbi:ASCH domain-containing protein [Arcanobacterium pinnipediorum]|uniref:ASCH domain-containing protein n=1 Tax=Arcanobacterium pinnipediorum TaxID=1503041 RepID=A0ABY5AGS7_9ACTO|nr:ASCH domain-containing protein [Arcanobacterium pinnipediorum]USR79282.1 ASCH domain-containing protein [Arcanobacterium pinnipediorum]
MYISEPQPEELSAFWTRAKVRSKLAEVPGVMGVTDVVSVEPPAFTLGDGTRSCASKLALLVVRGQKSATSSYAPAYDSAGLAYPKVGDLGILLDGDAKPVALIRNREVVLIPFDEVTSEVAQAEGEGDLEKWREAHERVFTEDAHAVGIDFDRSANVVVEYFDVMYRVDTDIA